MILHVHDLGSKNAITLIIHVYVYSYVAITNHRYSGTLSIDTLAMGIDGGYDRALICKSRHPHMDHTSVICM